MAFLGDMKMTKDSIKRDLIDLGSGGIDLNESGKYLIRRINNLSVPIDECNFSNAWDLLKQIECNLVHNMAELEEYYMKVKNVRQDCGEFLRGDNSDS